VFCFSWQEIKKKRFQHPVFNVKKEMFISGKGRKKNSNNEGVTKKGPKEHFLKIVKKKN
jgi:hypothetical protein